MALTYSNIIKWAKMILGKSPLHVNQDMGLCFSPNKIKGYYNNLTDKVKMQPEFLDNEEYSKTRVGSVKMENFPTIILQYSLGCYDLYLLTHEKKYLDKFLQGANKIYEMLGQDGSVPVPTGEKGIRTTVSAMSQGESASVFCRAFVETNEKRFLFAAERAVDYMLLPLEVGGTSDYSNGLELYEFIDCPLILNGWIFALFGLYDVSLLSVNPKYQVNYKKTVGTLSKELKKFDNGYWTKYDIDSMIASLFYHNLHIAQMEALFITTGDSVFDEYKRKWEKYRGSFFKRNKAFFVKALQKLREKE